MTQLNIGLANSGKPFYLPAEFVTQTFAVLAIRERVRIRKRLTFHPGATRTIGHAPQAVALADVGLFVEQLKRQLSKTTIAAVAKTDKSFRFSPRRPATISPLPDDYKLLPGDSNAAALQAECDSLRRQLIDERKARADAERRLARVRDSLRPQYDTLRVLFEELGTTGSAGSADRAAFEPWLAKAGRAGCKRLLEVLIERGELTRPQLGTLAGVSSNSGTFRNYLSWLRRNRLVETNGDTVKLIQL